MDKETLDLISPENFYIHTGELGKSIIEISEKTNILNIQAQEFSLNNYQAHLMFSILYDVETKTISARGSVRYEKTGNKTEFNKKTKLKYSDRNYKKLHNEIAEAFSRIAGSEAKVEGEKIDIEFGIGEEFKSVLKKMNDSGHFNIGIPTEQPKRGGKKE